MENSPLVLSKPETPNPLRSCEACARECRRARHRSRHDIHQTNRTLRRASGRPVGTTQDGTSDSDDAPETDAAADGLVGCLSAGRLPRAVVSCGGRFERPGAGGGHARRPFIGTAACPARDIAAWRAFYPGRGEGPRNRAERRTGENGNGDRRLGRRDNGGAGGDGGDSVAMRVVRVGRRHQRHPPPVGRPRTGAGMATRDRFISRSLRTLASSRSDRRPDARHHK